MWILSFICDFLSGFEDNIVVRNIRDTLYASTGIEGIER